MLFVVVVVVVHIKVEMCKLLINVNLIIMRIPKLYIKRVYAWVSVCCCYCFGFVIVLCCCCYCGLSQHTHSVLDKLRSNGQ